MALGAQLPQPCVRLVVFGPGPLADTFERVEILDARHAEQARVEERLHVGQHDLAVRVVLDLFIGLVADAHRPHGAIAGQLFSIRSTRVASPPTP